MSGLRHVLAHQGFRRLMVARGTSSFGSTMAPIALAFAVLALPGRRNVTTILGVVLLTRMAAQLVFFLYGGVLADRFSRRTVMVLADLAAGASQLLMGVLFLTGLASLPAILALTFLNGAAIAMFMPASDGLLPLLLPAEALKDAQAMLQIVYNATSLLGAACAGVLVATIGSGWTMLVDSATFFVSAASVAGIAVAGTVRAQRSTLLRDLRTGWHEFSSREWAWVAVAQTSLVNICLSGGVFVLGPVIALREYGGAAAWSAVIAAQAVGFFGGSLLALRLAPARPIRLLVLLSLACAPVFLLLAVQAPLWAVCVAMLVEGAVVEINGVLFMSVFYARVPEEALSRVSSYDAFASLAFVPLGFAIIGPLVGRFGERPTLTTYFVVVLVVTVAGLASRSVRTVTAEPEPAVQPEPV